MLAVVVVLALLSVVLAAAALVLVLARQRPVTASSTDLVPAPRGVEPARNRLEVVTAGSGYELRLDASPLMRFEPTDPAAVPRRTSLAPTYAKLLADLLDNPQIKGILKGDRFVLAKVPDVIRAGGTWMKTGDGVTKAIALAPESSRIATIPNLVTGGAAVGTAAVFWPAVLGVAAAAVAQQQITSAIDHLTARLVGIEHRIRDADLGVIRGARRLVDQVAEFGPPHLWPEQLRFELAVRRAALDPVCFVQRREAERLIEQGRLSGGEREQLERGVSALIEATLVRAQLDLATTMILLDGGDAPFGLERLGAARDEFARELSSLANLLDAALPDAPVGLLRHPNTAPTVSTLERIRDELAAVIDGLDQEQDLVLSLSDDEELVIEVTDRPALPSSDDDSPVS